MSQPKHFGNYLACLRPALGMFFLLLGTQAAHADFVSIVNGVFSDSNSVVSFACYNGGGSEGPGGLNCNPPGFVWDGNPNASVSGTTDTTGAATAASELLSLTSPSLETATAFASGDLSAGAVKSLTSGSSGAEGTSSVSINDNVHFTIAGADGNTVTPIQVTWTFDGALSGSNLGFSGAPVEASSSLQFGGVVGASEDIFGGPPELTGSSDSGWISGGFTSLTPSLVQFTGVLDLNGTSATVPFLLSLSSFASNGDTADFSDTSAISLSLPSNVSFTSDSGAFLTGNASPAPEPSTFALGAFVMAGLFVIGKRWNVQRPG